MTSTNCQYTKEPISAIRKAYFARLVFRIIVLMAVVAFYFVKPMCFDVVSDKFFSGGFSPLHIVWLIWVFDMLWQLIPVKKHIPLGSQKLFRQHFKPIREKINYHIKTVKHISVNCDNYSNQGKNHSLKLVSWHNNSPFHTKNTSCLLIIIHNKYRITYLP